MSNLPKKICPECGNSNPGNWIACANCGAALSSHSSPAPKPGSTSSPRPTHHPPDNHFPADSGGCIRGYEQGFGFGCGCLVFIIAIFWFLAYIGSPSSDTQSESTFDTSITDTSSAESAALGGCHNFDPPGTVVTQDEYAQLQTGMTYDQVAFTICALGTESHRSELGGIVTESYVWQNADGSNLIVMFQNNGLVNKTATMLP